MAVDVFSRFASSVALPDVTKLFEPPPPGTVDFGIGEPDFQPTKQATAGLFGAVRKGHNKYVSTLGQVPRVPPTNVPLTLHVRVIDLTFSTQH